MTYYQDPFLLDQQYHDEAYFAGFPANGDDQQISAPTKCINPWGVPSQVSIRTQHSKPELYPMKSARSDDSYISPYLDELESPFGDTVDTVGPLELQRQQSDGSQLTAPNLDLDLDLAMDMDLNRQEYSTPPDDQWPLFGSTNPNLEALGLSASPGSGSAEADTPITPITPTSTSTSPPAPMSAPASTTTFVCGYPRPRPRCQTRPQPQPQPPRTRTTARRTSSSTTHQRKPNPTTTRSSCARTKKRNPAPSSSSSEDDSASAIQKAKHAHSIIERRYRDNLNGKMMQLHRVLLAAETTESSPMNGANPDDAAAVAVAFPQSVSLDETKAQAQTVGRVRKSDIMTRAINYIHRSEAQMRHMSGEVARLQDQIRVYQKLVEGEG
ncbi:hypothetical protein G647_06345 [Cladophialophora carrionii CBS 160.54]|uniref:BHLH domain-containing protein n=1 Tax=Cladophialophora carrionii CBS 160.54 TaxID=1279043 RepID=V9D8G7_9EURO|nr:uncharacterized protein G647_06345 [Cladophialophora carrionii CBS 160.54]ETI22272.1 hypothetical protein G647_06345 [Cladophialophora carrionii CBS 160.54]